MPNYQEGKIYKIYNTNNNDIYVGSTTLKLCERMRDHRKCVNDKAKHHYPLYKLFSEYGVDTFYIELLEKCPCHDIEELRKKEGEYIRELRPSMNKVIAGRKKKEYQAEYRENNKDYIRQLKHQYRENNQDKILQYIENNREHINQTHKKHYEEVGKQPIECECGCPTTRKHLTRHRKSKKHIELMKDKLN